MPLSAFNVALQSRTHVKETVSAKAAIRAIVVRHARLAQDASRLADDDDLYYAGLTSLAAVNIMMALESHFNVEFPDSMLSRKTFASIDSLAEAVAKLVGH